MYGAYTKFVVSSKFIQTYNIHTIYNFFFFVLLLLTTTQTSIQISEIKALKTNMLHTDGLLGKPTARCPHVVNKLTRHSRTRDCDNHGRFHPLNGAVSAGDKLALRRGEFGVPLIL